MKITLIESKTVGSRHAEICTVEGRNGSLRYSMTGRDSRNSHTICLPPCRLTLNGARKDAEEFLATGAVPFRLSDMGVL